MKIIFHIGMGKTGTTSIQRALQLSGPTLAAQKAEYLGMWFDLIDASYKSYQGLAAFMQSTPEIQKKNAGKFATILEQKNHEHGTETFILSNEGIFGNVNNFQVFLNELMTLINVELIAYVRDPHQWLPSAFTQWTFVHKQKSGPLESYGVRARELINVYEAIRTWVGVYSDILTVRQHDTSIDVVADFSRTIGVDIASLGKRHLERSEPAETMLRAMFNSRFPSAVLPDRFNHTVLNPSIRIPSMNEIAQLCFLFSETHDIVEEKKALFEYMGDRLGLDFTGDSSRVIPDIDVDQLRLRLFDYLVEITLDQAERIRKIEVSHKALELKLKEITKSHE